MPSVVGSGRGDVEDVLEGGERLARAGARVRMLVLPSTPKPWLRDASFGWDRFPRSRRLPRVVGRAVTLSSHFGVTAPEPRDEPFGGPGPWTDERRTIEAAYGPDRTLHISLEEFGRTLTGRQQAEERHREGGWSGRERRRRRREIVREAEEAHALYRKFRALDRPNLLTLFPTFRPSRAFAREFPETVQCGPLWPTASLVAPPPRPRRDTGVWYASPSSSLRIATQVALGLARAGARHLEIRTSNPFEVDGAPPLAVTFLAAEPRRTWERRWRAAQLRIATGTRSLLEAVSVPGPFLYFNGVIGAGPRMRRHRPEKLDGLIGLWRQHGVPATVRRDLADFARGRRIAAIVGRAFRDPAWRREFPGGRPVGDFPRGFEDAGDLLARVACQFAERPLTSAAIVRTVRAASRSSKV